MEKHRNIEPRIKPVTPHNTLYRDKIDEFVTRTTPTDGPIAPFDLVQFGNEITPLIKEREPHLFNTYLAQQHALQQVETSLDQQVQRLTRRSDRAIGAIVFLSAFWGIPDAVIAGFFALHGDFNNAMTPAIISLITGVISACFGIRTAVDKHKIHALQRRRANLQNY